MGHSQGRSCDRQALAVSTRTVQLQEVQHQLPSRQH